jgi:hypothetical protein
MSSRKNKILLIISGESFRIGSQNSRVTGLNDSLKPQIEATSSHIKFIEFIKQKFNVDTDVHLLSYSTQYSQVLIDLYGKYLIQNKFYDHYLSGRTELTNSDKILNIEDKYDSILVIRPDMLLKEFFFEIFDPFWDKIYYPTMTWILASTYSTSELDVVPRVNDMMLFVPNIFFDKVYYHIGLKLYHEGMRDYLLHGISNKHFNFMLKTLHDSDSEKDYNPLYKLVGRKENKTWFSYGYLIKYNFLPYESTVRLYEFPDWSLFENTEEIKKQSLEIKNKHNLWEWWDNNQTFTFFSDKKFNKIVNLIELDLSLQEKKFHEVTPKRFISETYWIFDKTGIFFLDENKKVTSIFYKINENQYEGSSLMTPNLHFVLKRIVT